MAGDLRILQKKKVVYLRGAHGVKSWFVPVRCEAPTSYSLQRLDERGEWVDIPVEIEVEE
jgi:hypothetical protein